MPTPRRFPKPWTIVEHDSSFEITDANGFPLGYVYFEDDFKRNWASIKGKLTKAEARPIARAFVRLPELLTLEKR